MKGQGEEPRTRDPRAIPQGHSCMDCVHHARRCSFLLAGVYERRPARQWRKCDWSPSRFQAVNGAQRANASFPAAALACNE